MEKSIVVYEKLKKKKKSKRRVVVKSTKVLVAKNTRKRRRNRNRRMRISPALSELAKAIVDPCGGPLLPAVGVGSITARQRLTLALNSAGTATCGYVMWFPTYHNPAIDGSGANAYLWEGPSAATVPTNTTALPLGSSAGTRATTGAVLEDPTYSALQANTAFVRAKTISACMQLEYLGALSAVSGQVAVIKNVPMRMFTGPSTTDPFIVAPSVDQIFSFAAIRDRLQLTGQEAVWRPTDAGSVYRSAGTEYDTVNASNSNPSAAIYTGTPASRASTIASTTPDETYGICIAWRAIPATASNISINMVKTVSMELSMNNNSVEPTFNDAPLVSEGPDPIERATTLLDKQDPGWQARAIHTGMKIVGKLGRMYTENIGVSNITGGVRGRQIRSIEDW